MFKMIAIWLYHFFTARGDGSVAPENSQRKHSRSTSGDAESGRSNVAAASATGGLGSEGGVDE